MSITIIDKTKPTPPLYVREPKPDFRLLKHPELEIQNYYDLWYQRWIEGYKELTGPHVFYMQEIHLKDIYGNIFYPDWRDLDSMVFGQIKECMDQSDDGLWYKARDKGITSIFGAGMTLWFMRTMPGTTLNLTGKDQKNIANMFEDKIMVAYENMDSRIINPTPVNKNQTKDRVYLKLALKKKVDGEVKTVYSSLNLVESSESEASATNFSSTRTPYMYVDEAPLHKRIAKLIRSSEATRMRGSKKAGFLAMGGTVEDSLSQEELKVFYQLIQDAKTKGIRTFFVPAWMGLPEFSTNGWSDEKAGTEWVLRQLELKEKSSDPNDALAWRKNYPLSEDDIFNLSQGGGAFESDVMDLLNETQNRLIKDGTSEAPYKLIPSVGGIEAVPDKVKRDKNTGGFWLTEMPKEGQGYYLTIDGAASGKFDGAEEGSWIAGVIFKDASIDGDHYTPVGIYFERPNKLEDGYRHLVNLFLFYNKFDGMIHVNYETNAGMGGNFGTYLDNNDLFKYVMRRKDLTKKGYINTNKLGTAIDPHVLRDLTRRANIFLRKFGAHIKSKLFLANMTLPEGENADIRSAFLIFMASIADWDKTKKKKKERRFRTTVKLVRGSDGTVSYRQEKIPLSNRNVAPEDLAELGDMQQLLEQKYGEYWYQKASAEEKDKYRELKGGE